MNEMTQLSHREFIAQIREDMAHQSWNVCHIALEWVNAHDRGEMHDGYTLWVVLLAKLWKAVDKDDLNEVFRILDLMEEI